MRLSRLLSGTGLAWLLSALAASAQTPISVGYTAGTDFLPAFVAKDKGYFTNHGLDVTLVRVTVASNAPAALVSGSLQISMGTAPSLLLAREGGFDLVAIAGAVRHNASNPNLDVIVRKDLVVNSASDLVGKRVCVPGVNSIFDVLFRAWLMQEKVDPTQVTTVECPFMQMGPMLRSSTVDAVLAIDPIRTKIVEDQLGTKFPAFSKSIKDGSVMTLWSATRDWADKNRPLVKGFDDALAEGLADIKKDPEGARAIEKKYLGQSAPFFPNFSLEIRPEDFAQYENFERQLGILKKPVDLGLLVQP